MAYSGGILSTGVHSAIDHTFNDQLWWMYPIAKFFGHALYEYYYDIDFIDCAEERGIQERNNFLYKSYCDLVGSLVIMYAKDRRTTVYSVIKGIKDHADAQHNDQSILNLLRAVYGIEHFGYTIMRYCGLFKLSCCQDMKACLMSAELKSRTANQQLAKEVLLDYIETVEENIHKNQLRAFEFLKCHEFTLAKEMHLHGPYICQFGILLNYSVFSKYNDIMKYMQSKFIEIISIKEAANLKIRQRKYGLPEDKGKTTSKDDMMIQDRDSAPLTKFKRRTSLIQAPPKGFQCDLQPKPQSAPSSDMLPTILESGVPNSVVNSKSVSLKTKEKFHSPALVFTSTLFSSTPNKCNLITLPKDAEKFFIHEYDCRMKKHIAFQAASFELQNAKRSHQKLSHLIHQQRKFEEMWPSKRSGTKASFRIIEFFDENVFDTNIKTDGINMSELIKEAEQVAMLLRYTLEEL